MSRFTWADDPAQHEPFMRCEHCGANLCTVEEDDELATLVAVERDHARECPAGELPRWNFWLPDEDRSSGWTNHCYVLQFVCAGKGDTPEEAWESAKRGEIKDLAFPRDAFELPDTVVAIRDDAEHKLEVA